MRFDPVIEFLLSTKHEDLPGESAQMLLSPAGRSPRNIALKKAENIKESAVLMLLYPIDGLAHITLTKRNSYPGVHSGQISFPGGKKEAFDTSFLATATRETHEEVGIHEDDLEHIREMSELYIPPSNFLVRPFLAYSKTRPDFILDPREVSELIELPVAELLNDSNIVQTSIESSYLKARIKTPALNFQGHIIWGATAMMLSELKALLANSSIK